MIQLLPIIFFLSILPAKVTNTADLTIGEGVTMRINDDFVNNASVTNNGTLSMSGSLTGEITQGDGSTMGYFGGAEIPGGAYENLLIEGDAILGGFIYIFGNLILLEGTLHTGGDILGGGYNAGLDGDFIQENGQLSEFGYIIGDNTTSLGLTIDSDTTHFIGLSGQALSQNSVSGIDKHFLVGTHDQDTLTLSLTYRNNELNGLVADDLALFHSTDEWGLEWTYKGGIVDTATKTITIDAKDINGYWTAGVQGCSNPLAYNYLEDAFGAEYSCIYDYNISFHAGANLMSFYGAQDEDMSIENLLSSLGGNIIGISGNAIAAFQFNGQWIGSLTEINRADGYWLVLSQSDNLEFIGTPTWPDTEYCMENGNNLLSFSGYQITTVSDALPFNVEQCIYGIAGEGTATLNTNNGWVGSLTVFEPWNGYWFVNGCDEICFEFENGNYVLPRETTVKSVPDNLTFMQSSKQAFYFIEGIEDASIGDFIVAFNGNNIVGSTPYIGNNTTVPIMGDDGNEYSYGYANSGDRIELKLISGDSEYLLDTGDLYFENMSMIDLGMLQSMTVAPEAFVLHSAYPNPFNPSTNIKFDLPIDINVSLKVYDISGRIIDVLYNDIMEAGYHSIAWNAGSTSSGMYFVKLYAGRFLKVQKIMLIK